MKMSILFQVTKMIRGVGGRVIGSVSTKTKETLQWITFKFNKPDADHNDC